jgi:predicted lysophospholipase L1 biosynthesis ABC-type transport system permease subunit
VRGRPPRLLRELREVGEVYLAYRIMQGCVMVVVALAVLFVPTWILVYVFTCIIIFVICMVPLAVIWAFVRLVRAWRDSSY